MPAETQPDTFRKGSRLCAHCHGNTSGKRYGWKRCPVCNAAICTTCMSAHGRQQHADHWRFRNA